MLTKFHNHYVNADKNITREEGAAIIAHLSKISDRIKK